MLFYQCIPSPLGDIAIVANQQGIVEVALQQGQSPVALPENDHLNEAMAPSHLLAAAQQLEQYFEGKRQTFELPLAASGTAFQQQVWQALTRIPHGSTCSYAQLATAINNPKAVRAVGSANGKNKIAIIVPCHRVIGANNKLTGYAGGLTLKAQLLTLEGALFTP